MERRTMTYLILLAFVPMIQCNPMADREVEVMREVEMLKSAGAIADRDMHAWWAEYDKDMADYQSKRDGMICTQEDLLADLLSAIKVKVERVRFGWQQKRQQLQKIKEILHHEDYKNVTGLHKALGDYITAQDEQATGEDSHLKEEEDEVAAEQNTLDTHPCPCVWGPWGSWGACTVSCGGGSKTRTKQVAKNATNGGDECQGSNTSSTTCGADPCPINCVWGTWGEFGECSTDCGDGIRERHRVRAIVAQHGGDECEGENVDDKSCNLLEEARLEAAQQKIKIADLKKQLGHSVDCEWGPWSGWTSCSRPCGGGVSSRSRAQTIQSHNGGTCEGQSVENKGCNTDDCPFGKIMVATGANKNVVLIDPETGSKCDSNLAPFFTGLYGGAGGLITVDGEPTPLICGGNGPYTKKCYIGKESGGVWEDIGISLDGTELGWSDMGSATIGDWAFITGGWNQAKNDNVKSTFLVNGKGDLVRGPDFARKRGKPCVANIAEDDTKFTVAVLGGLWGEKNGAMARFECTKSGANCTRLANGPNPKVWMSGAGCGVLTAEDGSRVLVATANRGDKRTQILDLSKPGASWKFIPNDLKWKQAYQTNGFVTSKQEPTAGYFLPRRDNAMYKLQCKNSSTCTWTKIDNVWPSGYDISYTPVTMAVPSSFQCQAA